MKTIKLVLKAYDEDYVDQVESTITEPQYDNETTRFINEVNESKFLINGEVNKWRWLIVN